MLLLNFDMTKMITALWIIFATFLVFFSIPIPVFGLLIKRANMQDLNEFPLEHGFSEHPAIHDEILINKKRRSDRARIPRKQPIKDFILVEPDCKHSKDCKHWKTFSTSKKNSIRSKQWRESVPKDVLREKSKVSSARYRALWPEEEKKAKYERDNKIRREKYHSLKGKEREEMLAKLRAKYYKYKPNMSRVKGSKKGPKKGKTQKDTN